MTNAIIPVVDLPSMAHSLEARVPFLDHELMEFCAQIPPWIKYRWGREKYILRRAVRDALPPEICWRRKFGMSAPTRDLIAGIELSEKSLRDQGCFHPSFVMNLLAQHRRGQADQSNFLMAIATTLLWDDMFLKCSPCARP
jgi:asparagine synthase (glutamine-hydrolysing)